MVSCILTPRRQLGHFAKPLIGRYQRKVDFAPSRVPGCRWESAADGGLVARNPKLIIGVVGDAEPKSRTYAFKQ
jgi:hypothetical protein